ncbi:TraB/GumN family protein [Dyadobacter sp. CY345]|uniref:TraB/GumN family protein n=1 Tax=Dyadobacter sp. CY345 TaxID=2909335 RepID=UPI001F2C5D85|nr:TraB/GumN family protein [Dyadobacter sp. CY345]MCF2446525.1 TraB/GumN family protein [Dyadobacter sp. CY345]
MKFVTPFQQFVLIFLIFSFPECASGQNRRVKFVNSKNATILWKISGHDCKKSSYFLGTFHLADADWLYDYPQMKKVIDSTNFILTEAFTTLTPNTQPNRETQLKALPLLNDAQFQVLDSFFVARVGEGIKDNIEAKNMTVAEMEAAILSTLTSGSQGPNGITKYMDLDLFKLYQKLGRSGDRLDPLKPTEFDSDNIKHAKQHLARSIKYIENSDKSDWNIYQMKGVDQIIDDYKRMKVEYKLNETANFDTSSNFDFVPMNIRNEQWMSKITSHISDIPCLIAVGLDHLRYQTGLIMLLRGKGYLVEPVSLSELH